ncbi:MAG: hypothetical protein K2R93_17530 [Gemmatimonadaceae bacterium]|nr:hypothetical protein [Gemmatimonadaceae bacterium]
MSVRLATIAMVALLCISSRAAAQRPPLVGTVAPSAIGPAVPQPAPIGGLRTTPLPSGRAPGTGAALRGWADLRVIDAPLPRAGVVVEPAERAPLRPQWTPTYDKPTWVRDSTAEPSALWRSLIVRDVVCNFSGSCIPRTSRVRAGWIARCDCYAFADGLGRVWMVERR